MLLQTGPDIDARNRKQQTPLILAAMERKGATIKLLLDRSDYPCTHAHTYTAMYIYIYVCVCVMCVIDLYVYEGMIYIDTDA